MPDWLKRLTARGAPVNDVPVAVAAPPKPPTFKAEFAPAFATKLAVDSAGAPGRAGAEALYQKWAARWQEF
ncbi:MAG TPA: hypothetical protein VKV26_01640 [Dehalococcoidia bacterium]|nr:hypothetical protein [Dehalococcoidia bacterium]